PTFGLCPPDFPRLAPAPLLGSGSLAGSCDQGIGRLGVPCPIILDVYLLMAGLIPASQAGFMSFTFTRQFELQADSEAVRIMAAAGYNPEAAIQYLGGQSPPAQTSDLASMHPTSSQRVETVRSALGSLPARAYSPASGRFAEAKALAASVR